MSSSAQSLGISSTSLPSPSPTETDTSTSPVVALTNSSSLLFGFLVSVLSLFAVFMVSGIIWHRLVIRRRAIEARMSVQSTGQACQRPRMWDVWVVPSDIHWQQCVDAKPLAAETWDPADNNDHLKTVEPSPHATFWKRHLLSHIPLEIIYLFNPPSPPAASKSPSVGASQAELPRHGANVCVSVLIAMPHPPHSSHSGERQEKPEELHEMVIGNTEFFCHDPASSYPAYDTHAIFLPLRFFRTLRLRHYKPAEDTEKNLTGPC
ncbi:hypothetical protein F5I97DRAFT_1076373 [Phlebopus sp. FC_14]|nr:hypothetical protein F5I97DRAFT_1076373 [Phlebopus sp. FC_14]